jgi:hypothetical protein
MFTINKNRHLLLCCHLYSYPFSAVENGAILIESYLAILIREHRGKRICLVSFNTTLSPCPRFNTI